MATGNTALCYGSPLPTYGGVDVVLHVAVHSSVDLYSRIALLLYPNNSYTDTSASYDKETTFLYLVSTIASLMNTSDST